MKEQMQGRYMGKIGKNKSHCEHIELDLKLENLYIKKQLIPLMDWSCSGVNNASCIVYETYTESGDEKEYNQIGGCLPQ